MITASNRLSSNIPEEDRAFFMVMDIVFSPHQHSSAELGYYYEAECEDTFSMRRFQVAAQFFHHYDQHRPLKRLSRIFVKYVNISSTSGSLSVTAQHRIRNQLMKEFDLVKQNAHYGLVQMYAICCRVPNIFYLFMDSPDETLDEYLLRHKDNMLPNYSSYSKTFRPVSLIPYESSCFILRSVANTLLRLHENHIFHGRLLANSVFIRFNHHNNHCPTATTTTTNEISTVLLANLAFAEVFKLSENEDPEKLLIEQQQIKVQQTKELIHLYEMANRILECTHFDSIQQRDRLYDIVSIINNENNNATTLKLFANSLL
ncbi:LOW QUALITY PROTEIN: uncharacterized protein LOC113796269 [Dermatophagoides pteronyssinus]|uniref:LOW QUALITY PROTEIN: uncharacterized protein LOC113796269 n=1 Tax=Dermatophagoides pteronyssinus TaxID=6956 RepID=UPI003F665C65